MRNYFNYFTEIEEYFARKRGKNLLVSPLDWCLIELWKENGIPLHIALRGIDRSFEAAERKHRRPPATLFYCHPAVVEAFEEYRETKLGEAEEEKEAGNQKSFPGRDEVARHLETLTRTLGSLPGELQQRAGNRLQSLKQEVESRQALNYEEIEAGLNEVGKVLAESLQKDLSVERLREIQKEVASELKVYRKRISDEMYRKLKNSYRERRVREEFGLPEFSLFHL